ncbi:MAG: hypothetical protein Q4D04_09475 [Clostridia bacterium]|nr:hypothetical protein [Clostridia bacterium]
MKTWQPNQEISARDREILQPLIDKARELGRTPMVSEVPSAAYIKARFRIWKYAVMAAGLPAMNDPGQVRIREAESRARKAREQGGE